MARKWKLHKSKNDRVLLGVCGGVAEYCGISSTLVRILWALGGSAGVTAYAILALTMPDE